MEEHVILAVQRISWSEVLEMPFSLLLRAGPASPWAAGFSA